MLDFGHRELLRDYEIASAQLDPCEAERRELIDVAVAHLERFLSQAAAKAYVDPGDAIKAVSEFGFSERGRVLADVMALLAKHVDNAGVSLTSPNYLGYVPAGGLFHSAIGDFISAVTNRYAALFSISPGAAELEETVTSWIADAIGYKQRGSDSEGSAGGVLTSGGSIATLTAVVVARESKGIDPAVASQAVIYKTEHSHYCIDKALDIAGLAKAQRRNVEMDKAFRMSIPHLKAAILADKRAGLRPWLVCGSAGTVSTGAVDPLAEISDICNESDLWFHVDGAYGGLFVLCEEGKRILSGIAESDTVVVDPHKTLFLPYGTGALITKDRKKLYEVFKRSVNYIPEDLEDKRASFYNSLELTRHFRGLRVWLPLQLVGVAPFRAALSEKMLLASYFHERMTEFPDFILGPKPALSIATYRYSLGGQVKSGQ